jgi:hypothetical protein
MIPAHAKTFAVLLLMVLSSSYAWSQEIKGTLGVDIQCFESGAQIDDELRLIAFRIDSENVYLRHKFTGGKTQLKISYGEPVVLLVVGMNREFVPGMIGPMPVHSGVEPNVSALFLSRDTTSLAGRHRIRVAAEMAQSLAPDSDIANELKEWDEGKSPVRKPIALSTDEETAVESCLEIVRGCQLNDGAIGMRREKSSPRAPVWIRPYFGQYAALALLAANERKKSPPDMVRVKKWLEWCAKHQESEGFWFDQEGTQAGYRSNGTFDSWDSYAAMFLVAVDRYQKNGGKLTPDLQTASIKAFSCLQSVHDPADGLSWNLSDADSRQKAKYLQDNIETYAGLVAADRIFASLKPEPSNLKRATEMAAALKRSLPQFWQADRGHYSVALHTDGVYQGDMKTLYPEGTAQLFAIAFLTGKPESLWNTVAREFVEEDGYAAAGGAERWLVAASRIGGDIEKEWRRRVVTTVRTFETQNVYVDRASIAALGLLEGNAWLPALFDDSPSAPK